MGDDQPSLSAVEPGYKNVLRVRISISWVFMVFATLILDRTLLAPAGFGGWVPFVFLIVGVLVATIAPQRIYRRLRYRLTGQLLQVMRGWLFHVDTIVPLVRVQHLDMVRGPLDKMFGTASLIVHTAGTHNSTVTVPGLAPERAAEIRDIIREHVRTDFA